MTLTNHERPVVMLFLKEPAKGLVKTRLAATIGVGEATAIYRTMAEQQLWRIPAEFETEVHYAPVEAGDAMRGWLGEGPRYIAQSAGDLGVRLNFAFDHGFSKGRPPIIAIGADCPDLDAETLREAAVSLDRCDVVLGPAVDGGYYLIGMRRPLPVLFADIPWSSPQVLETTLARAKLGGLTTHLLRELEDIDDEASLRRHLAKIAQGSGAPPLQPAASS